MDIDRICANFEGCSKIKNDDVLERITQEGVPTKIWARGNMEHELDYENHRSVMERGIEVLGKAVTDVGLDMIIVFPVTRNGSCRYHLLGW